MHSALSIFRSPRWSPYAVGILIGVLSWITFAFMGKALGTSTSMVTIAGTIERVIMPEHVAGNDYLVRTIGTAESPKPFLGWQMMLVIFIAVGAFIAARLGGERFTENVPPTWSRRFGPSVPMRMVAAFLGGIVLIFGARMAGGCTSGHAISGGLQLALSSWVFTAAMFISGIATAMALFRFHRSYRA